MEEEFHGGESFEAILDLDGDKAHGLDGFSIAFFQKCWGVIKEDMMKVVVDFS